MLYLGITLVTSDEGFYQQNDRSMMKLDMTELTITRVILRNKKGVVIVVKIHEKAIQSVVLDFMTIIFRSGMILCDTYICLVTIVTGRTWIIVCVRPTFDNFIKQFILVSHDFCTT